MPFKSEFAAVKPDERFKELASNFFWSKLDQFGSRTLFVDHQTGRQWTGAQIKRTSSQVARALIEHNDGEASPDCVTFYKHSDMLQVVALGVLFAGGSVCAGYELDPEPEHRYMLEVIKPKFVFVGRELVDEMLRLRPQVCPFTIVLMDDEQDKADLQTGTDLLGLHSNLLAEQHQQPQQTTRTAQIDLPVQVEPDRAAFVLLTSGSTGRPKPVCRSQRNCLYVCHNLLGAEQLWDLNESSVVAAHLALDHGTGIFLLKVCLARGYKSIIMNGYEQETLLESIETYGITDVILGSALVQNLLVSQSLEEKLARGALGSLRNLLAVGSAIASGETARSFMRRLPSCSVRQAFGMTEAGFVSVVPRELALSGAPDLDQSCVGRILPNVEIKLVCRKDHHSGQQGEPPRESTGDEINQCDQLGELYVRSPTVSPGYVGAHFSEQARECFLPDGFYKSSDVCSMGAADGMLRVFGRFSEVLCLSDGWKVLPSEIEHTILEHPQVREAAVVGVPHPSLPTCHAPRAYVVARDGVKVLEGDETEDGAAGVAASGELSDWISQRRLFDFVAERLSQPKHLVGGIKFLPELPKISIGKIDKRKLKAADGLA